MNVKGSLVSLLKHSLLLQLYLYVSIHLYAVGIETILNTRHLAMCGCVKECKITPRNDHLC